MKRRSNRLTFALTCGAMLALMGAAALGAGTAKILTMDREKQLESTWCWAAVSSMAVNSIPGLKLADAAGSKIDQRAIVSLQKLGILTATDFSDLGVNYPATMADCATPGNCGGFNQPWLYGADFTEVGAGNVLTEELFEFEIFTRERPVIIHWDYSAVPHPGKKLPHGEHLLIIIGYDPDANKLRLFDPWPVDGTAEPRKKRERWITYKAYLDPKLDMGKPVKAMLEKDQYQIRKLGERLTAGYPKLGVQADSQNASLLNFGLSHMFAMLRPKLMSCTDPEPPGKVPSVIVPKREIKLKPVDFANALSATRSQIAQYAANFVVTLPDGTEVKDSGRFVAGTPMPIITLDTPQVVEQARNLETLFAGRTAVLLVPVIDRNSQTQEIVDSFLVYNDEVTGRWEVGGYANTEITQVASDLRARNATGGRKAEDFYLVSIPEQAAFYAAHGTGNGALLASVNNNGSDLVGAQRALDDLATSIRRYSDRDPTVVQPVQPAQPMGLQVN